MPFDRLHCLVPSLEFSLLSKFFCGICEILSNLFWELSQVWVRLWNPWQQDELWFTKLELGDFPFCISSTQRHRLHIYIYIYIYQSYRKISQFLLKMLTTQFASRTEIEDTWWFVNNEESRRFSRYFFSFLFPCLLVAIVILWGLQKPGRMYSSVTRKQWKCSCRKEVQRMG